jgi:heptosyltransferase-2
MLMNCKSILIVQTAFIGDVILITPLIRETKKLFPDAIIDVLVTKGNQAILSHNPYVNEIITIDKKVIKDYFRVLLYLRKKKYDLAITPHRSPRTLSLLLLAGIKERIGFNQDKFKYLLTKNFKHPKGVHKAEKNLKLLTPYVDYTTLDWTSELYFTNKEKNKSQKFIREGINIALAPGSVWNTKRWSAGYYSTLCRLLSKQDIKLIFIGSKGEYDLCAKIAQDAGVEVENSCGKLSITESAALISQCNALICNDSGALHIANAVNTQVFAFFGPTVQRYGYYPYRENDILFETELECRPCGMHGHKKCPLEHHDCMKKLVPEQVFNTIIKHLNTK